MLKFGIELEVAKITFDTAEKILDKLGLDYWSANKDDWLTSGEIIEKWVCKGDCTISPRGVEFNTPILEWHERLQIMPLIKEIRKTGAECNDTCGLHIHMSGDFPQYGECRSIFEQWRDRHWKEFRPCKRREEIQCQRLEHFIRFRAHQHLELRQFDAKLDCRWVSRCLIACRELGTVLEKANSSN